MHRRPVCGRARRDRCALAGTWLSDFPLSDSLDQVVRRRGSQRLMDKARMLPRSLLEWPMAAAVRGVRRHRASGMTFLDSEVPGLLGEPDDLTTLLFTCVGVQEYALRDGGGPGTPVQIRPSTERFKES